MSATDGRRVYAIGDVHGCRQELRALLARIEADLAAAPHTAPVIVFVGDYVDRGPDIRGTIDDLIELSHGPVDTVFLRGNHDQYFLTYLDDPRAMATQRLHWLDGNLGGGWTLRSYGVDRATPRDPAVHHPAFCAGVPATHRAFLEATPHHWQLGAFVFVHAGLRPGVALEDQTIRDMTFIREPFLSDPAPHAAGTVVHGHSAVGSIEHHGNRINIDSGAVFGGRLSCLVLEDDNAWDLRGTGRIPVSEGYGLV